MIQKATNGNKIIQLIGVALPALLLALYVSAQAQEAKKIPRIGVLATGPFFWSRFAALRQGLRELGYVEGKTFAFEYRDAQGNVDRFPSLAAELVQARVDVIYTASGEAVLAAKQATKTIPIVFGTVQDPVASGLVDSLARPGGNVTGLSALAPDLGSKRLELLKEVAPWVNRVAFFWSPPNPGSDVGVKDMRAAAQSLTIQLQSVAVQNPKGLDSALESVIKEHAQALTTAPDPIVNNARAQIVGFSAKNRLPAVYAAPEFAQNEGLMSYAPNYNDLWRRSAIYLDKILKGAKPADLPIEQPTRFELIINLRAAKQIGLTIPPSVLARANQVIK
jgi:putative tryptophan/tyrosine transport system substrate-binding protein